MKHLKALWAWLSRPSSSIALGVLVGGGIVTGVIGWNAFEATMHATSTDSFCLSCHELEVNIGVDFATRSHAVNASGVAASCSSCHIPEPFVPHYVRKARSIGEVYHHVIGTIDTPEKFEAYRMHMATSVWREMQSNDSRECRSCHDSDAWDVTLQSEKAQEFHASSLGRGKTCIDCHKGIAHVLPAGIEEDSPIDAAATTTHPSSEKES